MNEEFLYYIWKYQLFKCQPFTASNKLINVRSPGQLNLDSGPDFFNAIIQIGNTVWAGNIEIHINSSDWYKHGHQSDPEFNNIILHVVYEHDMNIKRNSGEQIPTLELKNIISKQLLSKYLNFSRSLIDIPCKGQLSSISRIEQLGWFDNLISERLMQRHQSYIRRWQNSRGDLLEIYYQNIFRYMGNYTNADSMELLARKTPLKILQKNKNSILYLESLLFGQSGLLSSDFIDQYAKNLLMEYNYLKVKFRLSPMRNHNWKFMRMRPASFPTIRISQLANLLYYNSCDIRSIFLNTSVSSIRNMLDIEASEYWNDHYRFDQLSYGKPKKIGNTAMDSLIINALTPMLFSHGKNYSKPDYCDSAIKMLSDIGPENNRIIRKFKTLGINIKNAMDSQAVIHLYNFYCLKKKCISCRFGHIILNRKN